MIPGAELMHRINHRDDMGRNRNPVEHASQKWTDFFRSRRAAEGD